MSEQDEIAQILNEIEGIQQDIEAKAAEGRRPAPELKLVEPLPDDTTEPSAGEDDLLGEFRAAAGGGEGDGGLEETLGELKEEPSTAPRGGIFNEKPSDSDSSSDNDVNDADDRSVGEVITMADHTGTSAGEESTGELSMTISGSMKLNLRYAADGQDVAISFDNGTLCVELADGTEFRVPMNRVNRASGSTSNKKAA